MKYIKLYEEYQQKIDFFGDTIKKLYDDEYWVIFKPNSTEDFAFLAKNTDWDIDKFDKFDDLYVNINKESKEKYLFDFYYNIFYDEKNNEIYLKDFFYKNKKIAEKYGDFFECNKNTPSVIKKDNKYWLVISGNIDFYDFFEKNDFVEAILNIEDNIFLDYGSSDLDKYGILLDDSNIIWMKVIVLLDSINNEYYIELGDIKTYYDIIKIIKTHNIEEIEKYLKICMSSADENAKESEAYDSVVNSAYDYFGLVDGTAKWENDPKNTMWIQFKSKYDASIAKFRILNLAEEYDDDKINYSQPYYGYDGDDKNRSSSFNQEISDRYNEYEGDDIANDYATYWENSLKNNIPEAEIIEQIKIKIEGDTYNL